MAKLSAKQIKFCHEYMVDLNATQAAIRAGYSEKTAKVIGSQNLTKVDIQKKISELQLKIQEKTDITAEMVVRELAKIGFANIDDFVTVVEHEMQVPVFGDDPDEAFEPETSIQKIVDIKATSEISKDKISAIASIKQGREGIEVKLHDKVKSLELLGRHLGIFEKDNKQKEVSVNVNLTKDEIKAYDKALEDDV